MKSLKNGVLVEMTAEEVTAREAEIAGLEVKRQTRADAIAQKETDKANAKAKLIAGEALTEAEADTIVI